MPDYGRPSNEIDIPPEGVKTLFETADGRMLKETLVEDVWPVDIAVDARGDVWIAELRGKIFRYDATSGRTSHIGSVETMDPTKIEHGIYGLEVDPAFYDGSPFIYVYYAEVETAINTLSRFDIEHNRMSLASELVLLRVPTEPQCCHHGGDLEWGSNETLYVSTGDNGMSETRPVWKLSQRALQAFQDRYGLSDYHWTRLADSERSAQNLQDLRGKILRINKDGTIPGDNPFFGVPGIRWEIYAYGLRNPYRFGIDGLTNALYIGVVGPDGYYDYDAYVVSEHGGENFGWPRAMGPLLYNEWAPEDIPDYKPSLWEYTYAGGGRAAMAGPFYRFEGEGAFPEQFQNTLFVYDWARSWINYGRVVEDSVDIETLRKETYRVKAHRLVDVETFDVLTNTRPISMALGPDGALYLAEFTGFWDADEGSRVSRYRWISRDD